MYICMYCICACACVGRLLPGGTVVEGTAGNTGIGLAHMCNALGYKCVIFMPNTQSQVGQCGGGCVCACLCVCVFGKKSKHQVKF